MTDIKCSQIRAPHDCYNDDGDGDNIHETIEIDIDDEDIDCDDEEIPPGKFTC